ncbi:MAG TPA: hypothetical protein VM283_03815, partial [Armatimonadota bacterium]|nr:hypothetical protein [Armatimonadota bacterium]
GYPVNSMGHGLSVSLAGWGRTASQRRLSRVEIWRRLSQLWIGYGNAAARGELMAVCTTTPEGARRYLGIEPRAGGASEPSPRVEFGRFDELVDRLANDERFDAEAIGEFIARSPVPQYWTFGSPTGPGPDAAPLQHGLGLRLMIPYAKAQVARVLLDGRPLGESDTDGWVAWRGSGTILRVNLPPERVRDFHIVQCEYDPGEDRPCGFTPEDWEL